MNLRAGSEDSSCHGRHDRGPAGRNVRGQPVLQTEDGPAVQVNVSVGSIERATNSDAKTSSGSSCSPSVSLPSRSLIYGTALVISCSGKSSSEGESCPA